jgi:hypothetical protein
VTARLMREDAAACWEAVFTASRKNRLTAFKAVSP